MWRVDARSVASNTVISIAARLAGLAIAFLNLWFITRFLGAERSGEYFTVLTYVGIANVVADLGLYPTFVREIARSDDESRVTGTIFSLRLASLAGILGVGAPLIAYLLPYPSQVVAGVWIGSLAFVCLSLGSILIGIFQKHLRMVIVALGELAARFVQLVGSIAVLVAGGGVLGVLGAMLAGSAVQFFYFLARARRYVPFRLSFSGNSWKRVLSVSYPVALSSIFSFIYFKVDSLMLSLMKPLSDVGIYGLAYKILEVLVSLPAIFVGIMAPILARSAKEHLGRFRAQFTWVFEGLLFAALPLVVGGALLSGKVIGLFGEGFASAAPVLVVLLLAVFAIFFGTLYANTLILVDRQKTLAGIYFVGMVANVAANLYAIPRWSVMGAAWTTAGTEILVTILMVVALRRAGFFSCSLRRLPRAFLATLGMVAGILLVPSASFFVLFGAGAALYLAGTLVFGAVRFSEFKALLPGARDSAG